MRDARCCATDSGPLLARSRSPFGVWAASSTCPVAAHPPMTDVLSLPVLVLNRHLLPVQVTTAKRAIVLLYGGVALALDETAESYDFELWRALPLRDEDDGIPIVGGALRVPRVVHLLRYDRTPRVTRCVLRGAT